MPAYNPDFNNVDATIIILDKGSYEFIIGRPKSFQRENRKGQTSVGVRYPMVVAEGPMAGKRTFYTCYVHTDGAKSFTKQFWMAASDFALTREGEAEFNASHKDIDVSLPNTELGECGDFWHELTDHHVIADVDIGVSDEGEPQQQWKRFRGITQAAPTPREPTASRR